MSAVRAMLLPMPPVVPLCCSATPLPPPAHLSRAFGSNTHVIRHSGTRFADSFFGLGVSGTSFADGFFGFGLSGTCFADGFFGLGVSGTGFAAPIFGGGGWESVLGDGGRRGGDDGGGSGLACEWAVAWGSWLGIGGARAGVSASLGRESWLAVGEAFWQNAAHVHAA